MTDWRVLLTRPAEESTALAALLAQSGIHSNCLPLLETEALPVTAEQHAVFGALLWFVLGGGAGASSVFLRRL